MTGHDRIRYIRKPDDRRVYEFILDKGPALAPDIGRAFPDLTQLDRGSIMKRLRNAGLVDHEIVIVKGKTIRRWRALR